MPNTPASEDLIDSPYAAWRLLVTLCLVTLGSSCMYVVAVVLPPVQAEFGVDRANINVVAQTVATCAVGYQNGIGLVRIKRSLGHITHLHVL